MANFEAFHWNFLSSTNPQIVRSVKQSEVWENSAKFLKYPSKITFPLAYVCMNSSRGNENDILQISQIIAMQPGMRYVMLCKDGKRIKIFWFHIPRFVPPSVYSVLGYTTLWLPR